MCGRFAQYRAPVDYLDRLAPAGALPGDFDPEPLGRFNLAPSTLALLLHASPEGLRARKVRWGWKPAWATDKAASMINAKSETVAHSRYWRSLWSATRAVVPADGWYEWMKDPDHPKRKQPYLIRRKDAAPLFIAALAQIGQDGEPERDTDGFVLITAAADAGLLDIHDRRPLVLTPEIAREWLDPDLEPRRAEQILREHNTPSDQFEWFAVNRAVSNARNEGPELIEPLPAPAR